MLISLALASSSLAAIRYDADATLQVVFRRGAAYRYFLVPRGIVEGLLNSASKGAYFNTHIRDRFRCERNEPS